MRRIGAMLLAAAVMTAPAFADEVAELGVPFAARLGDTVEIGGQDMAVRLAEVTEDSRCPPMVACVWSGRLVLALDVTAAAETATVTVDTIGETATVRGVVLSLLAVKPAERTEPPTPPEAMWFLLEADIVSP